MILDQNELFACNRGNSKNELFTGINSEATRVPIIGSQDSVYPKKPQTYTKNDTLGSFETVKILPIVDSDYFGLVSAFHQINSLISIKTFKCF